VDITPFIPIIVEATKFLFDEASQWIAVVRKQTPPEKSTAETVGDQGQQVVLDKQDFSKLDDDREALKRMLDRTRVESNTYRIKSLVDQIRIHHKNLCDLQETEAEFGALVPHHIRRGIERESEAILDKTQELQDLLSGVYQRKVQI
jgi:hypothetical protein